MSEGESAPCLINVGTHRDWTRAGLQSSNSRLYTCNPRVRFERRHGFRKLKYLDVSDRVFRLFGASRGKASRGKVSRWKTSREGSIVSPLDRRTRWGKSSVRPYTFYKQLSLSVRVRCRRGRFADGQRIAEIPATVCTRYLYSCTFAVHVGQS